MTEQKNPYCGSCASFTKLNMDAGMSPVVGVCDNHKSPKAKDVIATDHKGCKEYRVRKED